MPDDEIKIVLGAEDQTAAAVASAKKGMGEMSAASTKATEAGRLGAFAMGEGFEELGKSIGIPNQVARQMGNSVENLVSRMAGAAVVFGVVGLAVAAGVSIWKQYKDAQEKATEETLKLGQAGLAWTDSALKETAQTRELIASKRELLQLEFEASKEKIEDAIPVQRKLVESLRAQHLEAVQLRDRLSGHSDSGQSFVSAMIHGRSGDRQKAVEDIRKKFSDAELGLKKLEDGLKRLTPKAKAELGIPKAASPASLPSLKEPDNAAFVAGLGREADFNRARVENLAATGASLSLIHDAEALSFDTKTRQMMMAAKDRDEAEDVLAIRAMQRATMVANHEKQKAAETVQTWQMRLSAIGGAASSLEQMFSLLYQKGGDKARKYFSMYKIAAISNTIIDTAAGAMRAIATFGAFGIPFAAAITALGALKVQLIRRQQFDGGGGDTGGGIGDVGGGNVGTYPVNPNTGLPLSPWQTPGGVTLIINGKETNVKDLMTQGLTVLYDSNGTLGGLNVGVTRST